jgi:hypothetical protein
LTVALNKFKKFAILQVYYAFLEASIQSKRFAQQEFTACAQLKVSSDTGHLQILGDDGLFFLNSGSLLKIESGVQMCRKIRGIKRPDFWPMAPKYEACNCRIVHYARDPSLLKKTVLLAPSTCVLVGPRGFSMEKHWLPRTPHLIF